MVKSTFTEKQMQEVHKLVFLAGEYPDKTIRELGEIFTLSMLDVNATIWRARELGMLEVDGETGFYKVLEAPKVWDFGPEVQELMDTVMYAFGKLEEDENDIDDDMLGQWLGGNPAQNAGVAIKKLINDGKLATYELTTLNVQQPSKKGKRRGKAEKVQESTYTFYCLAANKDKEWGRKQFIDQSKIK